MSPMPCSIPGEARVVLTLRRDVKNAQEPLKDDERLSRSKGDTRKASSTVASASENRWPISGIEQIPLAMILNGRLSVERGCVDMTILIPLFEVLNCVEKTCFPVLRINEVR